MEKRASEANSRKIKAQQTKQIIFESALTLFRTKGFEAVTIEDITKHAGTSKGSFYTYFATKSDIIVEEFWAIDAYYRSYAPNLKRYTSASDKLTAFTRAQMRYVRDRIGVDMLKILYANQTIKEGSDKAIIDRKRFWHTFITEIIAEGQASGEFRSSPDAETFAVYFNRAVRGILLDWCISSGGFDLVSEGVSYCKDFLVRGPSGLKIPGTPDMGMKR
ncbi:MAG: TetR/AcrR family transcriptional regulator [Bacteroidetes bacterium]|nr:TetR/AcrR family transcriptional regulator [Bacteroidota bacterium]